VKLPGNNVPGKNGGQIVKTIAEECGVDLSQFCGGGKERTRARKRKLNGQEISVPSIPTCKRIKEDISKMMASGKLTLGEPCAPYTLTHICVVNGEIMKTSSVVHAEKFRYLK